MTTLVDAALDLLLGESCVGCDRPGRLLCRACAADLPDRPGPVATSAGLLQPWAAAAYDATVRAMVLGLKERRLLALAGPLAVLLSGAVAAAVSAVDEAAVLSGNHLPGRGPVVLVPVPSRPATVRARGHDPTRAVTVGAARLLRRRGLDVRVAAPLRVRRGVRDQSGLDATARAVNLAGSMRCARPAVARLHRRDPRLVVVCDDVVTTGSTAREAQRALLSAGLPAVAVAAVAATLRWSAPPAAGDLGFSADLLSPGTGKH